MIMSLKAASLGLNMVAACHVLMLDLWWNPTTEDQAIDRAHRIGQTRPVTVVRFTVKDTVEDRILALQVCELVHLFGFRLSFLVSEQVFVDAAKEENDGCLCVWRGRKGKPTVSPHRGRFELSVYGGLVLF